MRTILFLLQKEFIHIFRDKTMLPIIFLVPLIQLLVLVNAATLEMKRIDMEIVDKDLSTASRRLTNKFQGSPFFRVTKSTFSIKEAENDLLENRTKVVLHIPVEFEQNLKRNSRAEIQLLIDAVNGMTASLTNAYAWSVITDFNNDMLSREGSNAFIHDKPVIMDVSYSFWYNPELNFKYFMLPGILVILVSMIGLFLTALSIVREKERGTIEQINVTPIKKYQFIAGKLVPFWIIAMFELGFGLLIGKLLFRLPILGSISLIYLFAGIYLLVVLGLGLLISTLASSQQQVMFLTFFFLLTFILMSGIFTPAESMPDWAQKVNVANPFAYFMRVIRMIILKGSGFRDILQELISITLFGILTLSLAIWRYRKVA